jgi:hypothetical protein
MSAENGYTGASMHSESVVKKFLHFMKCLKMYNRN